MMGKKNTEEILRRLSQHADCHLFERDQSDDAEGSSKKSIKWKDALVQAHIPGRCVMLM